MEGGKEGRKGTRGSKAIAWDGGMPINNFAETYV
jgi:hypothetical protein